MGLEFSSPLFDGLIWLGSPATPDLLVYQPLEHHAYFWVQLLLHYFASFLKCGSLTDKLYLSSSTYAALACYDFTSCSNLFSATCTFLHDNCMHLSSLALHLEILPILIQALSIIHWCLLYDQWDHFFYIAWSRFFHTYPAWRSYTPPTWIVFFILIQFGFVR